MTVQDPMEGFFVAGSSIHKMNGIFGPRVQDASSLPVEIASTVVLGAYPHDSSGWILAHVQKPDDPSQSEWIFFDSAGAERFVHHGDTLIPGAGRRWAHLHRQSRVPQTEATGSGVGGGSGGSSSNFVVWPTSGGDDSDELPWQMIGLGDRGRMEALRRQAQQHDARTATARERRETLAAPPSSPSAAHSPPGGEEAYPSPDGVTALLEEDQIGAAKALATAAATTSTGWEAAVWHLRAARILRRQRHFPAAAAAVASATGLFPLFRAAIFERALLHLDEGSPNGALSALTQLHRMEPDWPELIHWLVRVHATLLRAERDTESQQSRGHAGARPSPPPIPPGCEEVSIGEFSPDWVAESMFKEVDNAISNPKLRCPEYVDKLSWLSGDTYDDWFEVAQEGRKVTVRRVDGGGQTWGMDLRFLCCAADVPEKAAAAKKELDVAQAAQREADARRFASPDHFLVLGVPCDADDRELKRAYRTLSLRLHPDREGGVQEHFARVATANDCLMDSACRHSFEQGQEFNGSEEISHQASFRETIERQYFPEHYPFEPFGDVFEDVRDDPAGRRNRTRALQMERTRSQRPSPPTPGAATPESPSHFGVIKEEL